MPTIGIPTLLCAIETIAREIRELQQTIDDGDAVDGDYLRMDDFERAARELEQKYDEAAKTIVNLPLYERLTGRC